MTVRAGRWVGWDVVAALVDPGAALRRAVREPRPWRWALWLGGAAVVLGLTTVPRQLSALADAMPLFGDTVLDAQTVAFRRGLTRLIVADRLVPAPTLLVAAAFVFLAAEPVLMLARDRRAAILTVVIAGMAPLLVGRVGELLTTLVTPAAALDSLGAAVELPHRFVTGPKLFTLGREAPAWLEVLDARVNLVSLWCVALWAGGLRRLSGHRLESWHLALPLVCLAGAGVVTWVLGPLVVQMLLR